MVLSEDIEQLKLQNQEKDIKQQENFEINSHLNENSEHLKHPHHIETQKPEFDLNDDLDEDNNSDQTNEKCAKEQRDLENIETAHIIEEIIEGISLQGRRGTLVRTISAVLR